MAMKSGRVFTFKLNVKTYPSTSSDADPADVPEIVGVVAEAGELPDNVKLQVRVDRQHPEIRDPLVVLKY